MKTLNPIPGYGIHYGLPMSEYHSTRAVHSSWIKRCDPPARLHHYLYAEEESDAEHFTIGTAVNDRVLGLPDSQNLIVRPDNLDGRTKAGKEWIEAARQAGRRAITKAQAETIAGASMSLNMHPAFQEIIKACQGNERESFEPSLFFRNEVTGLDCAIRPDIAPPESDFLVDIKTCRDGVAAARRFVYQILDFGYDIQGALYLDGWNQVTGEGRTKFVLFVVETAPPYLVSAFGLSQEFLALGRDKIRNRMPQIRAGLVDNEWPGYVETVQEIFPPGRDNIQDAIEFLWA